MLDDSLKLKDRSRFNALQRSLLKIERKGGEQNSGDEKECDLAPLPPSEFSFSLSSAPIIQEQTQSSRNVQPAVSTCSSSLIAESFPPAEQEYLEKAIKQNVKQYDAQLNITIVGNGLTGKTSVTNALIGSKFEFNTPPSTGYSLII